MEKRNHYLLEITKWTMEELQSEVDGYKQLGGVGVKDTIRKNGAEDELNWRNEKGYYDLTPEEIKEEEKDNMTKEIKMYRVVGGYQQTQRYSVMVEANTEDEARKKAIQINLSEWDDMQSGEDNDFLIFETEED